MKTRIFLLGVIISAGFYVASCSPKIVAMQPSDPNVPQMPVPAKEPNVDRIAKGKVVYEENCAKCHKLFKPEEFTMAEWGPILVSMQPKAHLGDPDMALISEYLDSLTN